MANEIEQTNKYAQHAPPPTPDGALMTAGEVAKILRVSPTWVRSHAVEREPRIKCVQLGKMIRFRLEDIREFIATNCKAG